MRRSQTSLMSSPPRSGHGVVPHTCTWALRPTGSSMEHRVEGGDLEHADHRHAEHLGHVLDRLLRQPAGMLLLGPPQQRDHRRGLPPFGIFRDLAPRQSRFSAVKGSSSAAGRRVRDDGRTFLCSPPENRGDRGTRAPLPLAGRVERGPPRRTRRQDQAPSCRLAARRGPSCGERPLPTPPPQAGEGGGSRVEGAVGLSHPSSVDLAEHDVDRAEDGGDVGQHVAAADQVHRLQVRQSPARGSCSGRACWCRRRPDRRRTRPWAPRPRHRPRRPARGSPRCRA